MDISKHISISKHATLYDAYEKTGDIRVLIDMLDNSPHAFTEEDAVRVMNIYTPDAMGRIPEVEHIEVMLTYFPKGALTEKTWDAIQLSFPEEVDYILHLRNRPTKGRDKGCAV